MRSRRFVNEHRWSPGSTRESAATARHQLLTLQSVAGNHAVATFVQRARRQRTLEREDFEDETVGADVDVDERDDVEPEVAERYTPPRPPTLGAFLDPALESVREAETRQQEAAALATSTERRGPVHYPPRTTPIDPSPHFEALAEARAAREAVTAKPYPYAPPLTVPPSVADVAPATKEPEQTVSEPPAPASDRVAVESALRNRLATTAADWARLDAGNQATVITEGMKIAIPSEAELRNEFQAARKRVKRGDKDAKARQEVDRFKANAVERAATNVLPLIGTLAKQAEERKRQENLAFDKNILRLYINSLRESDEVESILLEAVDLLSLSNAANGLAIDRTLDLAHIRRAAFRWDHMQDRVTDQREEVPDDEGEMTQNPQLGQRIALTIVKNMIVPGGANSDPMWKERGEYWEKTKNLVCSVGPAPNNVHLHTTGRWRRPKAQYKTRPTD